MISYRMASFTRRPGCPADVLEVSTHLPDPSPQPVEVALLARLPSWVLHGGASPAAGRLYLLLIGAVVVVTDLLINELYTDSGPSAAATGGPGRPLTDVATGHGSVLGVSVAMAVLLACSWAVPWERSPRWLAVVFPGVALCALVVLGAAPHALAPTLEALIPLTFVYAGLFLGMRETIGLLPLAWAAYLALAPDLGTDSLVRALTYSVPWLATGYFLQLVTRTNRWQREVLRRTATTDALTQLPNRRLVDERLSALQPGDSVVVCDLDHFKQLNDTRGHQSGDVVLAAFAAALAAGIRRTDFAGRLGGEEFVLVLPGTDQATAAEHVDRIRSGWAASEPPVTFSAGVAEVQNGDRGGAAVLARADRALYQAKRAGRDRVEATAEGGTSVTRRAPRNAHGRSAAAFDEVSDGERQSAPGDVSPARAFNAGRERPMVRPRGDAAAAPNRLVARSDGGLN